MIWNIVLNAEVVLWVKVGEDFLEWLRQEVRDPYVASIDPYRDICLKADMQQLWVAELKRVEVGLRTRIEESIVKEKQLPRDPQVRVRVLGELVDSRLQDHLQASKLTELKVALELALESGAIVSVLGD
jgi:hypothetical protein